MILIIIDAHSKWMQVYPVLAASSLSTIEKMQSTYAQFGVLDVLVTDNGTPFTSQEFHLKNGVWYARSHPYHPASNGLAEGCADFQGRHAEMFPGKH